MSEQPGTPNRASTPQGSGSLTPGGIANELSKMDFPAPEGLNLNIPARASGPYANLINPPASSSSPFTEDSAIPGDISGPEPEAIAEIRRKTRSESMSAELSEKLAHMKLPQPERIFGPDAGQVEGKEGRNRKHGVSAADWDAVVLDDDVPESVRAPERMTHSRNTSRADASTIMRSPTIPEDSAIFNVTPTQSAVSANTAPGPAAEKAVKEQKITPFDVEGGVDADGKEMAIDYDKTVAKFGAQKISQELLERFERVTGHRPHPLMRRGTFFSHRDFNTILDRYEQNKPFYLYTGRGPSSDSMHMGHLIPFMFTAWLQRVFNVPLVIQITDDEKYLLQRDVKKQAEMLKKIKGKKPIDLLRHYKRMAHDNIKDIIACGFILEKTYIFQDSQAMGGAFYDNVILVAKTITLNQSRNVFGFTDSDNVGMYHFAAVQATPSFSNSFPQIFGERTDIPALIPCAIDQDPYFLLTRDSADRLGYVKPCLLHSKFLPALQGVGTKMSASNENSAIFMTDDAKKIHKKIRSHAFSGGKATQEEHKRLGGDVGVDVAYQYLGFFEDDDFKMERLAQKYGAGTLSTVEMKDECIKKLQEIVADFQKNREAVTDDLVAQFQDAQRKIDPFPRKTEA